MSVRRLAPLLAGAALACGTGNRVEGTVGGLSLAPEASLLDVSEREPGVPHTETVLVVALSDRTETCDTFRGARSLNGSRALWLTLASVVPGEQLAAPNQAGVHEVVPASLAPGARLASAAFVQFGALCGVASQEAATAGQVVLLHLELAGERPARAVGTFDLTFGQAGHLSGQFETEPCGTFSPYLLVCGPGGP